MPREPQDGSPRLIARARRRQLRQDSTDAERKLWHFLRDRRLGGEKFRRQYPCGAYILDFYFPGHRLAIEVDGGQHLMAVGILHDRRRDEYLRERGITVLRFTNLQVLQEPEGVMETIRQALVAPGAPAQS